jgi:penicillin-binding protein 1C
LSTRFWAAVKTGTSKDMRDNWCLGFTSEYTVGVWIGNFDGSSMWNVSGASGAAPVWKEIIAHLNARRASRRAEPPADVGIRGPEKFLKGTEAPEGERKLAAGRTRIGYPAPGSRFAWDPDIPADRQRIVFEKTGAGKSLGWFLDGQALGSADEPFAWTLKPGRHELRLAAADGAPVDTVAFEVRGLADSDAASDGEDPNSVVDATDPSHFSHN